MLRVFALIKPVFGRNFALVAEVGDLDVAHQFHDEVRAARFGGVCSARFQIPATGSGRVRQVCLACSCAGGWADFTYLRAV